MRVPAPSPGVAARARAAARLPNAAMAASDLTESGARTTPDEFELLQRQLKAMPDEVGCMRSFYDKDQRCFAITRPTPRRASVTTTCFALLAVAADPSGWRSLASSTADDASRVRLDEVCQQMLRVADWRPDDAWQASLIVHASRAVDPAATCLQSSSAIRGRFAGAIEALLDPVDDAERAADAPRSAYIRFWGAQALISLLGAPPDFLSASLPEEMLPPRAADRAARTLERAAAAAYDEVCRQLAFRYADDGNSHDTIVLAYSLMTYVLVSDALASAPQTAGRRERARDAAGPSSALPPRNPKLVRAALGAVFAGQRADGLWDQGQPIFESRGSGNDVGNAYVFAPDMVASLLETVDRTAFGEHLPSLRRHLVWLGEHTVEDVALLDDGAWGAIRGWRSNHLPPEGGPLGWPTAQAARCIARVRRLSRDLMCDRVIAELGGRPAARPARRPFADGPTGPSGGGSAAGWDRLLDSDLPNSGNQTLKATLERRMLRPLLALADADAAGASALGRPPCADGCAVDPGDDGDAAPAPPPPPAASRTALEAAASYSAILFGPPGTAKTTVVAAIADWLGWALVTVDTSVFLANGLPNVARTMSDVFDKLQALENTVVLFDEVEEFCLDRNNDALSMESRMLTTAMLTKLADLRASRRVAFFIATNRLLALDAAVTRPGRFDLQLCVGTPNLAARMGRFGTRARDRGLDADLGACAARAFESMLQRRWEAEAQFLTFLETERLAAEAVALAASYSTDPDDDLGAELETRFDELLDSQVDVMTVRGPVREDFLSSMRLTRA